jgi:hypothetical protein
MTSLEATIDDEGGRGRIEDEAVVKNLKMKAD